jgi:hypothetical protein
MGPKSTIATNFLKHPNGTTNAGIIIAQILLSMKKVQDTCNAAEESIME